MARYVSAWQCMQQAQYYKAMNLSEQDNAQCSVGEVFFGELSNTAAGSFICNQTNGLYVQAHACQELTWICISPIGVQCRHSPDPSDKSESMVQNGTRISALPVPGKPGWLQEAATMKYLPMNHPTTGDALFTKVDGANPVQAAETWICISPIGVQRRNSADPSDKSDSMVQNGQQVSALRVQHGWLQESGTGKYLPMNHPTTGEALWTKMDGLGQVQAAPVGVMMGNLVSPQGGVLSLPPTVPPGSILITEKYQGNTTMIMGCVGCLLCGPCGLIVCCLELDERQCYRAPDGRKFDLFGKPIA